MPDNETPVETPEAPDAETNDTPKGNESETDETTKTEGAAEDNSTPLEGNEEKASTAAPKRLKFKIGDSEKEFDEDEIIKTISERDSYSKLHKEGKELHDTAKYILNQLSTNLKGTTLDILTGKLGSKEAARKELLKLADEIVTEEFKLASMPEHERQAIQLREELEVTKKKNEEYQREQQDRQGAIDQQKQINEYFSEISEAIKTTKGMDEDPDTFEDMAKVLIACRQEGHQITAKEVAPMVMKARADKEKAWEERMTADPARFMKRFPGIIEKTRELDLEQIREGRKAKTPGKGEPNTRADVSTRRVVTTDQLHDILYR